MGKKMNQKKHQGVKANGSGGEQSLIYFQKDYSKKTPADLALLNQLNIFIYQLLLFSQGKVPEVIINGFSEFVQDTFEIGIVQLVQMIVLPENQVIKKNFESFIQDMLRQNQHGNTQFCRFIRLIKECIKYHLNHQPEQGRKILFMNKFVQNQRSFGWKEKCYQKKCQPIEGKFVEVKSYLFQYQKMKGNDNDDL